MKDLPTDRGQRLSWSSGRSPETRRRPAPGAYEYRGSIPLGGRRAKPHSLSPPISRPRPASRRGVSPAGTLASLRLSLASPDCPPACRFPAIRSCLGRGGAPLVGPTETSGPGGGAHQEFCRRGAGFRRGGQLPFRKPDVPQAAGTGRVFRRRCSRACESARALAASGSAGGYRTPKTAGRGPAGALPAEGNQGGSE